MDAVYLVLSALTLAYLVASQKWLSPAYLVLLLLITLSLINQQAGSEYILALATAILLIPLLRFSYLAFKETAHLFEEVRSSKQRRQVFSSSFLRLLPFILLTAVGLYFSSSIEQWANRTLLNNTLYGITFDEDYGCEDTEIDDYLLVCTNDRKITSRAEVEQDILAAIESLRENAKTHLSAELNSRIESVKNTINSSQSDVVDLVFDNNKAVLPNRLWKVNRDLRPPSCNGHFHWITRPTLCIKKELLTPINKAYDDARNDYRRELIIQIKLNQNRVKANSTAIQAEINARLHSKIDATAEQSNELVRTFMRGLETAARVYLLMTVVYLLFLAIQTSLYIVVRNIFSPKIGDVSFSLHRHDSNLDMPAPIKAYDITNQQNGFEINLDNKPWFMQHSLFVGKGRANILQNHHATSTNPMPKVLTIRRFLSQTLRMDQYEPSELSTLTGNGSVNTRFVKVDLVEGQSLCIRLNSLVGFSQGIMFESHVSIVGSVFLQHSMFFTLARGTGSILLLAEGGTAELLPANSDVESGYDPQEIIAFDSYGDCKLQSNHQLLGFYLRFPNFSPCDKSFALRHSKIKGTSMGYFMSLLKKLLFTVLPI